MIHPQLIQSAVGLHRTTFAEDPRHVVAAPGRVNLIGEHVDYNGGVVLPMAIDRHTVLAASLSSEALSRLSSIEFGEAAWSCRRSGPALPRWARYVEAVVERVLESGVAVPEFRASVASNLPIGAGLSSSASLTVAAATLCEQLSGQRIDGLAKARLCQSAEHDVGVPCGLMDPAVIACGQSGEAVRIDCRAESFEYCRLWGQDLQLWVFDSGVRRALAAGHYARRRADCEAAAGALGVESLREATADDLEVHTPDLQGCELLRARHVVSEIARTTAAVEAARRQDWRAFGRLMNESHQSLRDDFEVSGPELETLVELLDRAPAEAVVGRRLTGAGFGGCVIALLRARDAAGVAAEVVDRYRESSGPAGAAFHVRAADGAGPVVPF